MPNIAQVLKSEIARIARKEVRAHCTELQKSLAAARAEIKSLRQRLTSAEKQLARQPVTAKPQAPAADQEQDANTGKPGRFSGKRLMSLRKKLGLSQADFGRLVGASSLSIYKWETGQVRPREKFLQAIDTVKTLPKAELQARIAQLGDGNMAAVK